ncbi:MAG: DinB family protein [Chloroflexota bacterium]|nr:DinB family protein [Chloroflexota bacterium]
MASSIALRKNIEFWHWYPELLVKGLTPEQLSWQAEQHDTSITFALWHAYRAADDLVHGIVFQSPSVFASQGWAVRLPVSETGATPFGNGLTRGQIGNLHLDIGTLLSYAQAVGASMISQFDAMTDEDAASEINLPFFSSVYPGYDRMSKAETLAFFAIGHTSEHLGEVQFIKGLMGLRGAPL